MKNFNSVIFSKTLTLLFLVSCLIACKSNTVGITPVPLEKVSTAGEPRNFSMGFSAIPKNDSEYAYLRSYDFAANYGESLVIRSSPFWKEFFRGSIPSEKYTKEILAQKHALKARNLNVVYVLDVFDPADRSLLFNLPAEYYGQSLASEKLKEAFFYSLKNTECSKKVIGNDLVINYFYLFNKGNVYYTNRSLAVCGAGDDSITVSTDDRILFYCYLNTLIGLISSFSIELSKNKKNNINKKILTYKLRKLINPKYKKILTNKLN